MTQAKVDERINTIITDAVDGDNLTNLTELVKYLKEHGEVAENIIVRVQSLEKNKADIEHAHDQYLTQDDLSILNNYAEKAHIHTDYANIKHEHEEYLVQDDLADYAKKEELFSRDYNDLKNLPKVLDIEKDNLATKTYVNETVANAITSGSLDLSDYALKADLDGLATEEYVTEALAAYQSEAEVYKVDFNNPNYADAKAAYESGKLLVLINAAPDVNSYALMNYVSEKYITFTKFLMSRSETYGAFNTYYLSPENT
jgi:hypothetical protein